MHPYVIAWLITGAIFTWLLFVLGKLLGRDHSWLGILVDDKRKRVSLAKFQLVVWTVVIFSAFAVVMVARGSVNIYLPPEVWGLLGISVASMAGAAVIKGTKLDSQPVLPPPPPGVVAAPVFFENGVLATSDKPRFTDIFKGDELENQDVVDLAKVQMFFLTVIAVVGYVYAMFRSDLCDRPTDLAETFDAYFPPLSSALLTILAISHAGYLTVKAAPHTRTVP